MEEEYVSQNALQGNKNGPSQGNTFVELTQPCSNIFSFFFPLVGFLMEPSSEKKVQML